jgi:hypothetical protein
MEMNKSYQHEFDNDEPHEQLYKVEFMYEQVIVDVIIYLILSFILCIVGAGILMLPFAPLVFIYGKTVYDRRRCYITSSNVVLKQQLPQMVCMFFASQENHVQLHNIVDVVIQQGFIQKQFGCYTVHIQNPGQTAVPGQGGDLILHGVKNAHEVKRVILDLAAKLKRGESVGGSLPVVSNTQYQMNQSSVPPMYSQEFMNHVIDMNQSLKRIELLLAHERQPMLMQQPIQSYNVYNQEM